MELLMRDRMVLLESGAGGDRRCRGHTLETGNMTMTSSVDRLDTEQHQTELDLAIGPEPESHLAESDQVIR